MSRSNPQPNVSPQVAANVRAELARQNKTRRELAVALDVDEHRIGKRTRGLVAFSVDEIVAVARFLGVTVEELVGRPEEDPLELPQAG